MSKEARIILGVLVLVLALGTVMFFTSKSKPTSPSNTTIVDPGKLIRDNSHILGSKDAKVKLVEFGDFQCPACAQAAPAVEKILSDYKDNPNFAFVFRNFPLPQHANALPAAEAAEAAGEQGKYWDMYKKLYDTQPDWETKSNGADIFVGFARDLGVNMDQYNQSVQQNKYAQFINNDEADGTALGVDATPTFFLNDQKLVGIQNYTDLKAKIDEALAK